MMQKPDVIRAVSLSPKTCFEQAMEHASIMEAHANNPNKSDFAKQKAIQWMNESLEEAVYWEAIIASKTNETKRRN